VPATGLVNQLATDARDRHAGRVRGCGGISRGCVVVCLLAGACAHRSRSHATANSCERARPAPCSGVELRAPTVVDVLGQVWSPGDPLTVTGRLVAGGSGPSCWHEDLESESSLARTRFPMCARLEPLGAGRLEANAAEWIDIDGVADRPRLLESMTCGVSLLEQVVVSGRVANPSRYPRRGRAVGMLVSEICRLP
jgi:hypothetical protein